MLHGCYKDGKKIIKAESRPSDAVLFWISMMFVFFGF